MSDADPVKGTLKFTKDERLHHRSLVEGLFRDGKSFYEFPFRVTWRILTQEALQKNFRNVVPDGIGSLQLMVTVPKKKRRRAVDRVKMRRRIRETYRLNRNELKHRIDSLPDIATLSLALVYIHDKNMPYALLNMKMQTLLEKLGGRLSPQMEK